MIGELRIEALKLEGDIFKLHRKMDKEYRINEYVEMKKILERKRVQYQQYVMILDEFDKQERLKTIKKENAEMKVFNHTNDENIEKARVLFLKHFKDEAFLLRIRCHGSFNHTDDRGHSVVEKIESFKGVIYLRNYTPVNPFTKAIAYAELPNIYFNSRKKFDYLERVETIAHEALHLMGYSHKGNYANAYNLGTVPYLVARMFKEYVSEIYGIETPKKVCTRSWKSLWFKRCYEISRTMHKYPAFDYSTGMSLE